ncbi:DUF3192 domain-containing protein [Alteromonas flava]|uniref:DUF3192 domain-containing protein n=1 Tax=Alteromonas flava TaxID=2048003 RepID=UPI000C28B869|nr:DUF3192 domain-containing protein [Alteromonas flava]
MLKKSLLLCALCAPLFLSGCVVSVGGDGDGYYQGDWEKREANNRRHISRLDTSMTLEAVSSRMGMADFDEFYQRDGSDYRVLYYRTQRSHGDGITSKDECTPLVFKNGQLVGWGETALREYL